MNTLKMEAFNELLGNCIDAIQEIEPRIRPRTRKGLISAKDTAEKLTRFVNALNSKFKRKNKSNKKIKKQIPNIYESYIRFQNILGYSLRPVNEISLAEYIEIEKSALKKAKIKSENGR